MVSVRLVFVQLFFFSAVRGWSRADTGVDQSPSITDTDGTSFYCGRKAVDWTTADKYCRINGLTLAQPKTFSHFKAIMSVCSYPVLHNSRQPEWFLPFMRADDRTHQRLLEKYFFWIGARAAGEGHPYRYLDGSSISHGHWLPGQAAKVATKHKTVGVQPCLMSNLGFDNNHCWRKLKFVCEKRNSGRHSWDKTAGQDIKV